MAGLAAVGTATAGWAATEVWQRRVGRWQIEGGLDAEVWVRRGHRRGRNGVGGIGGGIEVEGRRVGGCGRGSGGRHAPSRS